MEKDLDEAFQWFSKAAAQGYAVALNNLGSCYEYGKGVKKNMQTAISLYRKAAEKGQKNGISALSRLGVR